LILKPC